MPIYEYACLDCDNQFETLVLNSEEDICCPECDSNRLEKIMSAFSLAGGKDTAGCGSSTGFS